MKFKLSALIDGLTLADVQAVVTVRNRWGQVKYRIPKEEMFCDELGNWYFTLEHVPAGIYYATLRVIVPDDDFDKMTRELTDTRELCRVGQCCCGGTTVVSCLEGGMQISYQQVWTANMDDGTYLADKDGNLILTSDGKRIQFTKKE